MNLARRALSHANGHANTRVIARCHVHCLVIAYPATNVALGFYHVVTNVQAFVERTVLSNTVSNAVASPKNSQI